MPLTPVIEPTGIKLRAQVRALAVIPPIDRVANRLRLVLAVDCRKNIRNRGISYLAGSIGFVERDIDAGLANIVTHFRDVFLILAVRSILILDLYHDDGTVASDLKGRDLFAKSFQIAPACCEKSRIFSTDNQIFFSKEPPGVTAKLPFCARIGAGANHDP